MSQENYSVHTRQPWELSTDDRGTSLLLPKPWTRPRGYGCTKRLHRRLCSCQSQLDTGNIGRALRGKDCCFMILRPYLVLFIHPYAFARHRIPRIPPSAHFTLSLPTPFSLHSTGVITSRCGHLCAGRRHLPPGASPRRPCRRRGGDSVES